MSQIRVISKQPPGGRCSLYLRYAQTLHQALGYRSEVRYCDGSATVPPRRAHDPPATPAGGLPRRLAALAAPDAADLTPIVHHPNRASP